MSTTVITRDLLHRRIRGPKATDVVGVGQLTTAVASETRSAPSRLFGDLVCVAFITAQAVDGVCSYVGMHVFGVGIEANPLIAWYIATFGVGTALLGAKLVATICGVILHCGGMHRTVGVLTILYLLGAVWPWSQLLWR